MLQKRKLVEIGIIVFEFVETAITLPCKIDLVTLEVFDFEINIILQLLVNNQVLKNEYIIFNNLKENVYGLSEEMLISKTDYWYNDL